MSMSHDIPKKKNKKKRKKKDKYLYRKYTSRNLQHSNSYRMSQISQNYFDLSSRYLIIADLNLLADGRYLMSRGNEFQSRVPWDQKDFNPKSVRDGGTTSSLPFLPHVLLWHFLNSGARYVG